MPSPRRHALLLAALLALTACATQAPPGGTPPEAAAESDSDTSRRPAVPVGVMVGVVLAVGLIVLAFASGSSNDVDRGYTINGF